MWFHHVPKGWQQNNSWRYTLFKFFRVENYFVIMTYFQVNFKLNWLIISRDRWGWQNYDPPPPPRPPPPFRKGLKNSKSLSPVVKEKFFKSVDVKSNDENMMKSNDGVSFHHGIRSCFFGWFFKWKYFEKKIALVINEESNSHFEVLWKTSAFKTNKSSHQEVLSRIGVLKILTSHNGLYKI